MAGVSYLWSFEVRRHLVW